MGLNIENRKQTKDYSNGVNVNPTLYCSSKTPVTRMGKITIPLIQMDVAFDSSKYLLQTRTTVFCNLVRGPRVFNDAKQCTVRIDATLLKDCSYQNYLYTEQSSTCK